MHYVAGWITESFKTDLFVIWSEDNSEKLIIHCRVLGSPEKDNEMDTSWCEGYQACLLDKAG